MIEFFNNVYINIKELKDIFNTLVTLVSKTAFALFNN